MVLPLFPKATAVWLLFNTTLTFEQIADFCGMHVFEIEGIANGEVAVGIMGRDPIENGVITEEEIKRCQEDPSAKLAMDPACIKFLLSEDKKKETKYTPVARRQDKPNAILWFLKNCKGVKDSHIIKLIGTTKKTIAAIRDKSHWNYLNLVPRDPVFLCLCKQSEVDALIKKLEKENAQEELSEEQKNSD